MYANSQINKGLLQLYMLLMDEKEITYEAFNDYVETKHSQFSKLINEYKKMIVKLELNCTLITEELPREEDNYFCGYIYYQTQLYEDYSFKTDNLNEDDKKRYIYVLIYLMLKNGQLVSNTKIKERLNIDLSRRTVDRIINELKEIAGFDIIKDELQSYSIRYDI